MLPILNFYGNHNLDFASNSYDALKYHCISELRKLDIPDEILLMEYDTVSVQFIDKSALTSIENCSSLSFPDIPVILGFSMKKHIVAIGPMGMRVVFTPHHILLPSIICYRVDWYSSTNKGKV
jgi:hypothetical protein